MPTQRQEAATTRKHPDQVAEAPEPRTDLGEELQAAGDQQEVRPEAHAELLVVLEVDGSQWRVQWVEGVLLHQVPREPAQPREPCAHRKVAGFAWSRRNRRSGRTNLSWGDWLRLLGGFGPWLG